MTAANAIVTGVNGNAIRAGMATAIQTMASALPAGLSASIAVKKNGATEPTVPKLALRTGGHCSGRLVN